MDSIIVKTKDLQQILKDYLNADEEYTELSIIESDDPESDSCAFLCITVCNSPDMNGGEAYDFIDSIPTQN